MPRRAAPKTESQVPQLVASLRRVLSHVTGDSSDVWMDLAVTMPQIKVLMLLRENGAMRVGVLARHLNVSTPTITGVIDRLVRQGLVERRDDPDDRRVVLNALTAQGEETMERLQRHSDDELRRLVGGLPAEEQTEILQSLKRLDEALAPAS